MNDKRDKYHGTEVSRDEMIKELGDPSTWGEEKAKLMHKFHEKRPLHNKKENVMAPHDRLWIEILLRSDSILPEKSADMREFLNDRGFPKKLIADFLRARKKKHATKK